MRSMVEEASSIAKAVEKAWNNAGNPSEFKVKVLELPETGFLGMTRKPARVSLFFDTAHVTQVSEGPRRRTRDERPYPRRESDERSERGSGRHRREQTQHRRDRSDSTRGERNSWTRGQDTQRSARSQQEQHAPPPRKTEAESTRESWTPEMATHVETWLKESLVSLNLAHRFSVNPTGSSLKIDFEQAVHEDRRKERLLFSGFAHLIMETVRNRFKKRLRNLKVCINSPNNNQ